MKPPLYPKMTICMLAKAFALSGSPSSCASFWEASFTKRATAPGCENRPTLESGASNANCGATRTAFIPEAEICAGTCWRVTYVAFKGGAVTMEEQHHHGRTARIKALGNVQQDPVIVIGTAFKRKRRRIKFNKFG